MLRHQLRRAAAVIAAANDEDLLRLRGGEDQAEGRAVYRWRRVGRPPAPREAPDHAGHWHRGARPASDAV
ncbi:hypothetical protein [Pseudofrankia inefficax]|uniref:Uncharacterized protein n=1 Tax=Pseudofrankia inefficax (strain DSM 45817 / CECT 9037 / DDB 130130 / EuI1c) TaxID=298654 RepID=E3J6Y7_PSEI1|nr:hypothetical protein [Pseudofrankia inefficax]ADP83207.1 hypothetical protein FraEuI1c_5219 [Pseudofrankia inefficax]